LTNKLSLRFKNLNVVPTKTWFKITNDESFLFKRQEQLLVFLDEMLKDLSMTNVLPGCSEALTFLELGDPHEPYRPIAFPPKTKPAGTEDKVNLDLIATEQSSAGW
jgi:hypothetical protein